MTSPIVREVTVGSVRLIQGDALDVLPLLPSAGVVITDPPYGVREEEWDAMTEREFARFSMAWMSRAFVATPEAYVFGYLNNAVHKLAEMMFPRVRPLIWAKPPGSQLSGASEKRRWFAFEAIFHCHQGDTWSVVQPRDLSLGTMLREAREEMRLTRAAVEYAVSGKKTTLCARWEEGDCIPAPREAAALKQLLGLGEEFDTALAGALTAKSATVAAARSKASANAAGDSDILSYRTETGGLHPCEKPLGLMRDIIRSAAPGVILDPFAGSGSTLVACMKEGREAVGIERDPKHFATALRRVEEAYRQPDMFVAPPPAPVQEALL